MSGSLSPNSAQRKTWFLLAGIAVLAVVGGLVLPHSLPSPAPLRTPAPIPASVPTASGTATTNTKDDLSYTAPSWPEAPDPRPMLVRLALGTVVVLGLCVGTLWMAKRWQRGTTVPVSGQKLLLIETLSLGNRCALHLVSAGGRSILVGADGSGLKSLLALTDGFADVLADAKNESMDENLAATTNRSLGAQLD